MNQQPTRDDEPAVLDLADGLHREAEQVLADIRLSRILRPYGEVVPTGSYYLNVMVYPDIDLYFPRVAVEKLFEIGGQFASDERVVQVVFEQGDASMPGGLYLKLRIAIGERQRLWKVDLWSLDRELIEQKMGVMRHFAAQLTPALRLQILRYKLSVMTPAGRTPMYSGYFIYKAFIDQGLTDFSAVTRYLQLNGIQIG